ncbi:putative membrane protein YqgA involved in biofilm formation [Comamonas sp. BIGb0152]|uniref:hypothetical protein n=1 Tax=Comamonas sp. BIGb0152 TaxID=2940601 RepID=UPI002167C1C7|nr:hypothetical protein [Comamonas sp. BIGb0152]MCS4292729.1 putative membrane protein YqgA involved in biofilm formation [Comamonas sp. BIGb0152]
METTAIQSVKLVIVSATGLSKDALHIYVGIAIFLVARLAFRKYANMFLPVAVVVVAACIGELLDMRDDINSLGYWRWAASLHDVVNTAFWPFVLSIFMRSTLPSSSN